jgi:MoaA/NifB/PqqE/SkfB family radical SAM enzyme
MANILLTTRCNLNCAYCFAQERLEGGPGQVMAMHDVRKVVDFLKRSEHPIFRVMGGEPTLHPRFPEIVELALHEGMRVDVLSNATWPERFNDLFGRVSPRRLFFLLNIDHPENYTPRLWSRIENNLAAVTDRGDVTLSFNLFEVEPRAEYLFDLLARYRIGKVRMSFSLPVVGTSNAYLKLEDYFHMPPFILDFVHRAEELGVQVKLDNAVPLCIFSFEEAGELLMKGVLDFEHNARCEPIIDIGPDLSVWCCFCLSKLWNRHLDEFEDLRQIVAFYRQMTGRYQGRLYPMDECYACPYRELWRCQGGCLTFTIWRHGEIADGCTPARATSARQDPAARLALAGDVEIHHYDIPTPTLNVFDRSTGLELEMDASHEPLLALLDGGHSAEEVVERYLAGNGGSGHTGPIAALAAREMKTAAHALLQRMQDAGFVEERKGQAL